MQMRAVRRDGHRIELGLAALFLLAVCWVLPLAPAGAVPRQQAPSRTLVLSSGSPSTVSGASCN